MIRFLGLIAAAALAASPAFADPDSGASKAEAKAEAKAEKQAAAEQTASAPIETSSAPVSSAREAAGEAAKASREEDRRGPEPRNDVREPEPKHTERAPEPDRGSRFEPGPAVQPVDTALSTDAGRGRIEPTKIEPLPAPVLDRQQPIDTRVPTAPVPPAVSGPNPSADFPQTASAGHTPFVEPRAGQGLNSQAIPRYSDPSIVFTPASQVDEHSKNWGIAPSGVSAPVSSMRYVFTGTVVSIDPNSHAVVVQDRRRNSKTLYVGSEINGLRKGSVIQATIQPGSSQALSVRQVIGG